MAAQHAGGAFSTRYKFNGKELDPETGYYYYGARYYDPVVSRWLSVDPLAEKYPGLSPYNYTANNPVMLVDPDGRDPIFGKNFWGKVKLIGDDGKNNGKVYLVRGKIKRAVKRSTKKGEFYKGALVEGKNVIIIPTGGVFFDVISSVEDTKISGRENGGHSCVGDDYATRWDEGPAAIPFTDKYGNKGAKATLQMFMVNGKKERPDIPSIEFWWHTHPKTEINGLMLGSSKPSKADFIAQALMRNQGFKGNTFVVGLRTGKVSFYNENRVLITINYSDFKWMGLLGTFYQFFSNNILNN